MIYAEDGSDHESESSANVLTPLAFAQLLALRYPKLQKSLSEYNDKGRRYP